MRRVPPVISGGLNLFGALGWRRSFMTRAATTLALAAATLGLAPAARAQDGELPATFTSDRPGFANTSGVAARASADVSEIR